MVVEVQVADETAVAVARRRALAVAANVGFDEVRAGQLAIVATELSTNLVKHGGGGKLLIGDAAGHVDLLALDLGRGMNDVDACMADGYSSAGTPGNGLGAVRRLAQQLQVASWPGRGTAVFARVARTGTAPVSDSEAGLSIAKAGEEVCGDAWTSQMDQQASTWFVVDGLGHGVEAALAAQAAITQFHRNAAAPVAELLQGVHLAMRHTRGGAVAVARLERATSTVAFAGLGNIAAALVPAVGQVRHMVSLNGIAGHNARKVHTFEYPCTDGLLIMHSDGIGTGWTLQRYPGFMRLHPMLLAGLLYRDFARSRDDATVVVARTAQP